MVEAKGEKTASRSSSMSSSQIKFHPNPPLGSKVVPTTEV
jgi:hypothetical protein